ncbi:hypothetical protein SKAU_G00334360 [Synaphobranchus kaupii]|uniref:Uncharacterized protein n=1 Tax=Synaphobranchus kaupii TaxID=118154 RepID=A0A9Q1IHW7_SYNKA|nr:hypothetical protein SKAU_G00334360 [Synaphobranchus kaupii]
MPVSNQNMRVQRGLMGNIDVSWARCVSDSILTHDGQGSPPVQPLAVWDGGLVMVTRFGRGVRVPPRRSRKPSENLHNLTASSRRPRNREKGSRRRALTVRVPGLNRCCGRRDALRSSKRRARSRRCRDAPRSSRVRGSAHFPVAAFLARFQFRCRSNLFSEPGTATARTEPLNPRG